MLIVYYYRTDDPAVLKAYMADQMAVARIEATAERFAKQFGAKPYYSVGFDSHFAGIGFDKDSPCPQPELWSKPSKDDPRQVPRSPERAGSLLRPAAEKLYKQFHDTWPKEEAKPRESELLKIIGLGGQDMTNQLLVYHEDTSEKCAYLASSLPLALPEVPASVFVVAYRMAQSLSPESNNG
jgi:hypothetical protein